MTCKRILIDSTKFIRKRVPGGVSTDFDTIL